MRIAITGLGPKPFRARAAEKALEGKKPGDEAVVAAASNVAEGVDALSDIHASAEFRAELALVYTRRALTIAIRHANP